MNGSERYSRQISIAQIGEEGQQRLKNAYVTVIGAGGLGSPVLTYIAAAGIGHIRVIDCDRVSLSNMNRQFLHFEADIGRYKTDSAAEKLRGMNGEIEIESICEQLTEENATCLIGKCDAVVDCVDNLAARLAVTRACLRENMPLIEGGISGFYGYVTAVNRESACLACMGCAEKDGETPVIGATAGVIGSLQANECIKILLGVGEPLFGRMLQYDGLSGTFDEVPVFRDPECPLHNNIGG